MSKLYTVWNSPNKVPTEITQKDDFFKSNSKGDLLNIVSDICRKDSSPHIEVYGGDGSVYEACNAVMESGISESITLTVVPSGTGNDFIKNFSKDNPSPKKIDLIKFNKNYCANVLNIGFDCDVVMATDKIKKSPLFKGSFAYILGVISTVFKPLGKKFDFEYITEDGEHCSFEGELLLCLIANGKYYGGGFKCAPLAELDDELLELIYVKKLSLFNFARFIMGYKKGNHIDSQGNVIKKYSNWLVYKRIKSIKLKNVGVLCADGEILDAADVDVSVVPSAINIYN